MVAGGREQLWREVTVAEWFNRVLDKSRSHDPSKTLRQITRESRVTMN